MAPASSSPSISLPVGVSLAERTFPRVGFSLHVSTPYHIQLQIPTQLFYELFFQNTCKFVCSILISTSDVFFRQHTLFLFQHTISSGGHPFHLRQQTPHHKLISSVDHRINLINHGELIFSNENKSKVFPLTVARNCQIILTIHLNSKTSHSHLHFPRETKLTRGKTR